MRVVFADSYYWIAFINERDAGHDDAIEFSQSFSLGIRSRPSGC